MRFDLDAQQQEFQRTVGDYLAAECPLRRALAPHDNDKADIELWQGLMGLGLGAILVPEEYGGLGLGMLDLAVVTEQLGRHAAPGPFLEHALGSLAIILGGSDAQRAKWLPGLSSGELRATIAFAETADAWKARDWKISGSDKLSGEKRFVLYPQGADVIVVCLAGGGLGLVEAGASGLGIAMIPSTDAGRQLGHVNFDATPFEPLARPVAARIVDAGLVLLAADAFGGAAQCVAMSVAYAKEREQFGEKIGTFQALKHQLADMAVAVEPCIGLCWYAAHAFDTAPADSAQAARLAKAHMTELFPQIARRMIEAHGGIGYTWEYGAHVWLKRALFDQAYLGMPGELRQQVAALSGW